MPKGHASHRPDFHSSVDDDIEQEKIDWLFVVNRGDDPDEFVATAYYMKWLEHKMRMRRLYARRRREIHGVTSNRYIPKGT